MSFPETALFGRCFFRRLDGREPLLEVGDDVIDVLGADGEADGALVDVLVIQFFFGQLRVGRGGRVDDQALDVRDVREQREDGEVVDELPGLFLSALDVEGEDGGTALREVLLIEIVLGMVREGGMVDLLDQRVARKVLDDLLRVLRVPLQAERQGLDALKEQERVEGRDGGAGVPQENGTDVRDERCGTDGIREGDPVIAGVRVGDLRVFARGLPVELAGLDDDTAEGRAVAAEELGGGVDDDVGTGMRYGVPKVLSMTSGMLCA